MNTDFQYYMDNTPLETVNELSAQLEDDKIEKHAPELWDLIIQIWEKETGEKLSSDTMEDEKINKLFFDFQTLVSIYIGCRQGKMKVTSGRLVLSDPNQAVFTLTERGLKSAEKLIKKINK